MRALLAVSLATGVAHAEPAVTLKWEAPEPAQGLAVPDREAIEGIAASETVVDRNQLRLGPRALAATRTAVWSNERDRAQGWSVGARYVRDLGWDTTLSLDADLVHSIGGLERDNGDYASVGIALTKWLRFAHGRIGWISIGITHTTTRGDASRAPGGTVVGLRLGATF